MDRLACGPTGSEAVGPCQTPTYAPLSRALTYVYCAALRKARVHGSCACAEQHVCEPWHEPSVCCSFGGTNSKWSIIVTLVPELGAWPPGSTYTQFSHGLCFACLMPVPASGFHCSALCCTLACLPAGKSWTKGEPADTQCGVGNLVLLTFPARDLHTAATCSLLAIAFGCSPPAHSSLLRS